MKRSVIALLALGALACAAAATTAGVRYVLRAKAAERAASPIAGPAGWRQVRDGRGHVAHLREDIRCSDCHKNTTEGWANADRSVCTECHLDRPSVVHAKVTAFAGCTECHTFTGGQDFAP